MADQGRWFKLWAESLSDPDLGNLTVADFGRWAKFGVYLKVHGSDGSIHLSPPSRTLQAMLELSSFDAVIECLRSFPHCDIRRDDATANPRDDGVTVTWRNWRKDQTDSSAERQRRYRHRQAFGVTMAPSQTRIRRDDKEEKRREEKRPSPPQTSPLPEEKRREEKKPAPQQSLSLPADRPPDGRPAFRVPASVLEALTKSPTLGAAPRLRTPAYWQAEVRANPGVDFAREVLKAEAWMQANPTKAPKRDFPRFLHTWLSRADREADDAE